MLAVKLICAGKLREKFYIEAFREYEKRLAAFCRFETVEVPEVKTLEDPSEAEVVGALEKEARAILEKIPQGAYVIALCVEGTKFSSEELAKLVAERALAGDSRLCFIIGSSNGLHPSVKQRAEVRLSVSDMTFPHHLFRVMLAEQIYRVFTINAGRKYHK
ncbi:MAG: 23S rRNA (pseudouridine(1915)-N(3))-methyltransferase RlmH [Oscillospiraceae bacterium]|jgi:23S rRNA (pseudouridine1915-N3)-methyltransferase|nr:23S rRNA (pseudouridine(1915)-N(3))-methyltransferase RlmH [Oscillospiraceae bacterium]